jgi:hypothetical protein
MQYRAHPLPCLCLVRELVDGVLSYAAVLRGGLGPLTPPLCRYAEYTADQILRLWQALHRPISITSPFCVTWLAIHLRAPTQLVRSLGAWCGQRSGIKGEPAGRRTAAELSTPSAKASTALEPASMLIKRKTSHTQTQPIGVPN